MLALALGVTTVETDPLMLEKSMDFVLAILNTCSKDKRLGNTNSSKVNQNIESKEKKKQAESVRNLGRIGSRNLSAGRREIRISRRHNPPQTDSRLVF